MLPCSPAVCVSGIATSYPIELLTAVHFRFYAVRLISASIIDRPLKIEVNAYGVLHGVHEGLFSRYWLMLQFVIWPSAWLRWPQRQHQLFPQTFITQSTNQPRHHYRYMPEPKALTPYDTSRIWVARVSFVNEDCSRHNTLLQE